MAERPVVGTGVWIRKDGKVLLSKRIGKHGTDTWSPPGGHLEMYESFEDNVRREVGEETGLKVSNIRQVMTTNNLFPAEEKHSVTIFFVSDWESGEVVNREPEKHEEFGWYEWGDLPEPLFTPARIFVEKGYNPFTS